MPLDPVSAGVGGVQALFGLGQTIFGGGERRKAEKDLENYANSYKTNGGILDFYSKALAKYNPNAYQSAGYQQQNNQIQRNLTSQINAGQNRRTGLMGVAGAVQQANDASAKAVGNAEAMQNQNLGILGQATNMKAGEERRKYDMLYNLKAMKAGQKAGVENAGYRNIFGGLGTMATLGLGDLGGNGNGGTRSLVGASNQPRRGLSYIPQDEQLPY